MIPATTEGRVLPVTRSQTWTASTGGGVDSTTRTSTPSTAPRSRAPDAPSVGSQISTDLRRWRGMNAARNQVPPRAGATKGSPSSLPRAAAVQSRTKSFEPSDTPPRGPGRV
jgi:hypothetical protein